MRNIWLFMVKFISQPMITGITRGLARLLACAGGILVLLTSCQENTVRLATVPFTLDHNRMLIDAEIQRKDGSWRKARLWVDSGNPDFFLSPVLARDLGIDLSTSKEKTVNGMLEVAPPTGVRIGRKPVNFNGVKSVVLFEPGWLFSTMHNDANLPATVLKQYQVVFDYPKRQFTIAEPGSLRPRGLPAAASVHPQTGIVQIDAVIDGDSLSLALDNGASYSFVSADIVAQLSGDHPDWPRSTGAIGCANIWGWWPEEPTWPIVRIPEFQWGSTHLVDVGIVGLPNFFPNGSDVGDWYSHKTARPVAGLLGPNVFKFFRIEIDYPNRMVYFEKSTALDSHDLDLVGLTLRPEADSSFQVIGVAHKDGKSLVDGVAPGDVLIQVGDLKVKGATMGTVVDALRGTPGDIRTLVLERDGKQFRIEARVERFL